MSEGRITRGRILPTIGVLHRNDFLVVVEIVQKGRKDAPASVKLVVTHKVGVVALEAVEDQRLVRFRNLEVRESSSVGEVELRDNGLHAEAWQLGVHLDVDTLIGLDAHNKLVPRNVLEDTGCDILELNPYLGFLLVERLARLQDEGNAVPALILNVRDEGAESRTPRVLWNCVVLLVRGLTAVERLAVLADDDVLGLDGREWPGAREPFRRGCPLNRMRWVSPWRAK